MGPAETKSAESKGHPEESWHQRPTRPKNLERELLISCPVVVGRQRPSSKAANFGKENPRLRLDHIKLATRRTRSRLKASGICAITVTKFRKSYCTTRRLVGGKGAVGP